MTTTIRGSYEGQKQTTLTHTGNNSNIITDAPKDNNGLGREFSPTDMVAGALGSCITTIISIVAERDSMDLTGTHFSVDKHMSETPRRIAKLDVTIHLPETIPTDKRDKLERAGLTCPVHQSLHPEVEAPVKFIYDVK